MSDSSRKQKSRPRVALTLNFAPTDYQNALLAWYDANGRDLPWRVKQGRADPYQVWLSEIMLQQTTVKAVIPYYRRFLERWPNAQALAKASHDEVLAAWAGLGYYSRAHNLHACAKKVAENGFPQTVDGLRALPGVGAYTAAAIASIAFEIPATVVDGNVERVISRVFAVEMPMPTAKPALNQYATELTPYKRAGDYAQAMMDLGATICTPKSPSCILCPVRRFCAAFPTGAPEQFPIKPARTNKPTRYGRAFVIVSEKDNAPLIFLRKRKKSGLLAGMYEVPSTEWVEKTPGFVDCFSLPLPTCLPSRPLKWQPAIVVRHTFTHFHLELSVCATFLENRDLMDGEWAAIDGLDRYALPTLMQKVIASGLSAFQKLPIKQPTAMPEAHPERQLSLYPRAHPPEEAENAVETR